MVSEIGNIARGGAGVAAAMPSAPAHASSQAPGSSAIQIPETPKVVAPKPVAIKFDASEVRQNLQEAVSMLNQQMASTKRGLGFQIDEAVGGPVRLVRIKGDSRVYSMASFVESFSKCAANSSATHNDDVHESS